MVFTPLLDKKIKTFVQIYGFYPTFGQKTWKNCVNNLV